MIKCSMANNSFTYVFPSVVKTIEKTPKSILVNTYRKGEIEPFKTKKLSYNGCLDKWMGVTSYNKSAQNIVYDITAKEGKVTGAHLDTARPDIQRTLKAPKDLFAAQIPLQNPSELLNYFILGKV